MNITPKPTRAEAEAIQAALDTVRARRAAAHANERPAAWTLRAIEDARRPAEPPIWSGR